MVVLVIMAQILYRGWNTSDSGFLILFAGFAMLLVGSILEGIGGLSIPAWLVGIGGVVLFIVGSPKLAERPGRKPQPGLSRKEITRIPLVKLAKKHGLVKTVAIVTALYGPVVLIVCVVLAPSLIAGIMAAAIMVSLTMLWLYFITRYFLKRLERNNEIS